MTYHVQCVMSLNGLQSHAACKYTCPRGWTTEYYGYLMSIYYKDSPSEFTCVDVALKTVPESSSNHVGMLFLFVEGLCLVLHTIKTMNYHVQLSDTSQWPSYD